MGETTFALAMFALPALAFAALALAARLCGLAGTPAAPAVRLGLPELPPGTTLYTRK